MRHALLEHGQQAERGDHPGDRRRPAQRVHDQEVGEQPDRRAGEDAGGEGRQVGPAVVGRERPEDVGADHPDRTVGEVDHGRAAVDDDQDQK